LYLIECEDGTLYTGVALDVVERFIKHLLGLGAAYTRSHPPLRVLASRCYPSKGDALRAEYALKQLPRQHKLNFFESAERLADAALPALRAGRFQ
jgi:putative endonuclease